MSQDCAFICQHTCQRGRTIDSTSTKALRNRALNFLQFGGATETQSRPSHTAITDRFRDWLVHVYLYARQRLL